MDLDIDPLAIARGLWEESQNKPTADEPRKGASVGGHLPSK